LMLWLAGWRERLGWMSWKSGRESPWAGNNQNPSGPHLFDILLPCTRPRNRPLGPAAGPGRPPLPSAKTATFSANHPQVRVPRLKRFFPFPGGRLLPGSLKMNSRPVKYQKNSRFVSKVFHYEPTSGRRLRQPAPAAGMCHSRHF
jgi:hypothetical protein